MVLESINEMVFHKKAIEKEARIAELFLEYLEKHGENELTQYVEMLEESLEIAIEKIQELEGKNV